MACDADLRDARQIEALAAGDDRRRHLVGRRRGQDKYRAGRRLLEGLEKSVPRRLRKLVSLIDDVDLGLRLSGRKAGALAEAADVVDPPIGGRVDLDQVEGAPGVARHAGWARAARIAILGALAVQRFIENARQAGFPRAARAA